MRKAPPAVAEREPAAQLAGERLASLGDQVVPDVPLARSVAPGGRAIHGEPGDLDLVSPGGLGQLLDGLAVAVAGGELLPRVDPGRLGPEHRSTRLAFSKNTVQSIALQQPQAGDAVADRHLVGGLPPVLPAQDLGQVVGVPGQPVCGGGPSGMSLSAVPQGLVPGDQEGVGRSIGQRGRDRRVRLPDRTHAAAWSPLGPGGEHLAGQPPQVLQQGQPEHGRHRPQLADRERGDLLERLDEPQDRACRRGGCRCG